MTFDESADPDAWIGRAEENFAYADPPVSGVGVDVACHLAQMTAELAMKAVYVAANIPHPYTHEIGELLDGLEARGVSIPDEVSAADKLTVYAAHSRYPGVTNATEADRVEAVRLARLTLEWARAEVARRRDKADA